MMFKSKTKYTWEGWESSGKEDWVFSVKHPCGLIDVHAKLIDNQLIVSIRRAFLQPQHRLALRQPNRHLAYALQTRDLLFQITSTSKG